MPLPTLEAFYDMLNKHDWYYHFSDSPTVYTNGYNASKVLSDIASLSKEHLELYQAFEDHYFTGAPFGSAKIEKPKRPKKSL